MTENLYYIEYVDREFYGFVMDASSKIIFEIEDTNSIRILIAARIMKHIDDVKGLTEYLRTKKILKSDESVEFAGMFR